MNIHISKTTKIILVKFPLFPWLMYVDKHTPRLALMLHTIRPGVQGRPHKKIMPLECGGKVEKGNVLIGMEYLPPGSKVSSTSLSTLLYAEESKKNHIFKKFSTRTQILSILYKVDLK